MLLSIANYANETGKAWPGIETLAQRTRQTQRNAVRIIDKLEQSGEISIEARASDYGTNVYTLHVNTDKKKRRNPKMSCDISGKNALIPSDIPGTQMSCDPLLTINKDDPLVSAEKEPRKRDELFDAIAEVCRVDPSTAGSSIGKVEASLLKADPPYTPAEVKRFGDHWWSWDQRTDAPTLWKLKEQIGAIRIKNNNRKVINLNVRS